MSIWTEPRVETLKSMWADGHSATQIACRLDCGLSRNAVIGKVSRLGLSKRKTVTFRTNGSTIKRASTPRPVRKPEPKRIRLQNNTLLPIPVAVPEVFTDKHFRTLLQLENEHCRFPCWPDGAPIDKQFFCGSPTADVAEGRPYCSFHSGIAYAAAPERKPQKYWRAA